MATALIRSGGLIGALAGKLSGRVSSPALVASYAGAVAAAQSFADQLEVAATAVSFADADITNNFELVSLVSTVAQAILQGRDITSVVDADYTVSAAAVAAACKAMAPSLT